MLLVQTRLNLTGKLRIERKNVFNEFLRRCFQVNMMKITNLRKVMKSVSRLREVSTLY